MGGCVCVCVCVSATWWGWFCSQRQVLNLPHPHTAIFRAGHQFAETETTSMSPLLTKISYRNFLNVFLVNKKPNLITCQITARCVRHLSHGRPFCRPLRPSSGRCIHTAHNPLLPGCTKNTHFFFFYLIHSYQHCLKFIFSICLPHFSISTEMLNGHLTRFGSVQSNFRMRRRLWLLPQDVFIGQVAPVNRIPQDQLTCVGAAGEQPVWGRVGACMSDAGQPEPQRRCQSESSLFNLWLLTDWPLTLMSDRIWSWWSDRQRISATDIEESVETVNL